MKLTYYLKTPRCIHYSFKNVFMAWNRLKENIIFWLESHPLLVKVPNIWLFSVLQCVPKMKLFCIIDSLQDKLNWNTSMKPQKMFSKHHEMMWNALKEYWQKYWDSKMWFWPYLPKLLIDDFGIVIGADQLSTN